MNKQKHFCLFLILMMAGFACFPYAASADTSLDDKTLDLVSKAVLEVVVKKPVEDSLTYEKPLPLELLPYYIRTDDYYSIGSGRMNGVKPTIYILEVPVFWESLPKPVQTRYGEDNGGC
mgnify:CR=1 FL=1